MVYIQVSGNQALTCVCAVSLLYVKESPVEVVRGQVPEEFAHGGKPLRALVD